jgi:uncharacterized protein YndB with AHSA1/START domain
MASTYTVQRTRSIDAPPDRVYALLRDFHEWPKWSPWEDLDPDMKREYSGSTAGKGAVYTWSGNRKAGAGRMEIVDTEDDRRVDIDLAFEKPFKSENRTSFLLAPKGDATEVTWQMTGPRPLMMRIAGPLMNMDKLVGKDFDKGLDRLQRAASTG